MNDYIINAFKLTEDRRAVIQIIVDDPVCREILSKSLEADILKLDEDRKAIKYWKKFMGLLTVIGIFLIEEFIRHYEKIMENLK
jgi:hypothetical protein